LFFPRKYEANSALAPWELLLDERRRSTTTTTTLTLGVKRWHSLVGWLVKKGSKNVTWAPIIIDWHPKCDDTYYTHKCQKYDKYCTLRILHWNGWNHKSLLYFTHVSWTKGLFVLS
jgi:hypothetical protein